MALLEGKNIKKSFARGKVRALAGVDFSLSVGETLAVVGESGSGKSTLAKIAAGLLSPDGGEISFEGRPLRALRGADKKNFHKNVQIVFQHPFFSLNPRMKVADILKEPFRVHRGSPRGDLERSAAESLATVEMDGRFLSRYPAELSGGECQRVAIARALSLNPKVLICDEAVSALDALVQAQILNLLLKIQFLHKIAFLFISHDLRVARHMSDRILVVREGQAVEEGESERIFAEPSHLYTQELLRAAGMFS